MLVTSKCQECTMVLVRVIVSTSSGVVTGKKAVVNKVGGEIICTIW